MPEVVRNIEEIRMDGRLACARISWDGSANYIPGQYALGSALDSDELLPSVLFPVAWEEDGMLVPIPAKVNWTLGTQLKLHAPLGIGFALPVSARRIALVDPVGSAERLLSLLDTPQAREGSVVVLRTQTDLDLPEMVEALPMDELGEIVEWADFIAVDLSRSTPEAFQTGLGIDHNNTKRTAIQALMRLPMVCGLNVECGLCSVKTQRGWKLGCKDGPVFDWWDLED